MTIKVAIISIGKSKKSHLEKWIDEYLQRLQNEVVISFSFVKQLKPEQLQKKPYIALDIQGKILTSESFATHFFQWSSKGEHTYVIGADTGLPPAILQGAIYKLSLSKMTFTHQMARLILVEQIYRAVCNRQGGKYHK